MRRSFKSNNPSTFYRTNERITAHTIRLIGADGKQINVLTRDEALAIARDRGVDLVEVAPHANPPVVKLIDFSKFLYQQKKKRKEEKKSSRGSQTKEIWFGPNIHDHDLDIKLARAREFVKEGNKVKFAVKFKGRLISKKELGEMVLRKTIEKLADVAKVEREIHMEGRQMVTILAKLK